MIVPAPAALPSRRAGSVNRRNSEAASSSCSYGVGEQPGQDGVVRLGGRAAEVEHRLEVVLGDARHGGLVAQQLDELRGERAQQVGLEAAERRDDVAAAEVAGESAHCFSMVAQRPYSCIACTSRSISSRLPVLTADLPSSWTSIIKVSAFCSS